MEFDKLLDEIVTLKRILSRDVDLLLDMSLDKLDRYYNKKEFPVKKLIKDAVSYAVTETLGPLETVYTFSQCIIKNKSVFGTYVTLYCQENHKKRSKLQKEVNDINIKRDPVNTIRLIHAIIDHDQTLIQNIEKSKIEKFLKAVYI